MVFAFMTVTNAQTSIKEKSLYQTSLNKSAAPDVANRFTELSFALFSYTSIEFQGDNYQLSPIGGCWGVIQSWGVENTTLKTTNAYMGCGIGSSVIPYNFNSSGNIEHGKTPLTGNLIVGYQIFSANLGYDFINKHVVLGVGVKISPISVIKHSIL